MINFNQLIREVAKDNVKPSPEVREEWGKMLVKSFKELVVKEKGKSRKFNLTNAALLKLIKKNPNPLGFTEVEVLECFNSDIELMKNQLVELMQEKAKPQKVKVEHGERASETPEVLAKRKTLIPILADWFKRGEGKSLEDFMNSNSEINTEPIAFEKALEFFKGDKNFLKEEVRKYANS